MELADRMLWNNTASIGYPDDGRLGRVVARIYVCFEESIVVQS